MGVFSSTRVFPNDVSDYELLVKDITDYFALKEYEVVDEPLASGNWHISISKGGLFKSVLGMKTSLNVEIINSINGTTVTAEVGIFGQQAIPSVISLFIAWPVLLTQIWGAVKQSKLDDEVMLCIEQNIGKYDKGKAVNNNDNGQEVVFCVECGEKINKDFLFCPKCGAKRINNL